MVRHPALDRAVAVHAKGYAIGRNLQRRKLFFKFKDANIPLLN
jgi:hypothetical protein